MGDVTVDATVATSTSFIQSMVCTKAQKVAVTEMFAYFSIDMTVVYTNVLKGYEKHIKQENRFITHIPFQNKLGVIVGAFVVELI